MVAATLALVLCGLLASGVAVTSILRHSLISRIDSALMDATRGWAQAPWKHTPPTADGPDPARPPSKFYVRAISPDGKTMTAINDRNAEPALPADNDVGPNPTTLPSVSDSDIEWRVVSVHGPQGGLTTVAIDLSDVDHTVRALVWLQVGIGAVVLVVVGIASFAVVHRSLRPLGEVEETAAAIAGDSSIDVSPNATLVPRWAGCRRRSTGCWPRFRKRWPPRRLRRRRPAPPRSGCAASSPTPVMNCGPR